MNHSSKTADATNSNPEAETSLLSGIAAQSPRIALKLHIAELVVAGVCNVAAASHLLRPVTSAKLKS